MITQIHQHHATSLSLSQQPKTSLPPPSQEGSNQSPKTSNAAQKHKRSIRLRRNTPTMQGRFIKLPPANMIPIIRSPAPTIQEFVRCKGQPVAAISAFKPDGIHLNQSVEKSWLVRFLRKEGSERTMPPASRATLATPSTIQVMTPFRFSTKRDAMPSRPATIPRAPVNAA